MTRSRTLVWLATAAVVAGCSTTDDEPVASPPSETPTETAGDDEDGEDDEAPDEDEDDDGGLQRGGGSGGSELTTGGGVEAPPLERRALELFSDLGADQTQQGALVELPDDVLFDFDEDVLRSGADALLDDLAELAELTDEVAITVVGHTDGRGSDDYNLDLSQRRADAVAAGLADRGVDAGRIEATGVGSAEPIRDEGGADDEEARARNRRVEVTFEGVDLED